MTGTLARAKDRIAPKTGKPLRREWNSEEALAEIDRLRSQMTTEEIERVRSHIERIRNSIPTERKYLADELVWPWMPCPTNGHIGYRFRYRRANGSLSGMRCSQCRANRTASRPKKKPSTHPVAVAMRKTARRRTSNRTLGKILFGLDNYARAPGKD